MIRYRLEYQYGGSDKWTEHLWCFDGLAPTRRYVATLEDKIRISAWRIIAVQTTETVVEQSK